MATRLRLPVNENDHIKGAPDAPIELLEYGDYQCPHCGAAHPVVKAVESAFGKNLKFVFRHFPLSEIHSYAAPAAVAAEAAGRQGKFWQMHDMIFEHQAQLGTPALLNFAQQLGLNMARYERDIEDTTLAEKVETDFESGIRSGVNGTPSFFINSYKYDGEYDFDSLAFAIKSLLTESHHR